MYLFTYLFIYLFIYLFFLSLFSEGAMDWITRAMSEKASDRMTPIRAKSHPWLKIIIA